MQRTLFNRFCFRHNVTSKLDERTNSNAIVARFECNSGEKQTNNANGAATTAVSSDRTNRTTPGVR